MRRLSSIDTFRGISILWMFLAHILDWWLITPDRWLYNISFGIIDPVGSSGFIFIAGISTALSLRSRYLRTKRSDNYDESIIKHEYLYRASLIFIAGLLYNIFIAITLLIPLYIWTWFVLLTMAVSLFMAWPLFKLSIKFRILIAIAIWFANQFLLFLLLPYEGTGNFFGVLFHIFYHSLDLDVIFAFFPFFIFGGVIGELIFKIYQIKDIQVMKITLKKRLIYPCILIGLSLITIGIVMYYWNYDYWNYVGSYIGSPEFFVRNRTFPWLIYTIGIDITLLMVFIIFEEFIHSKKREKRNILFYYSFYSLTIYLSHNVLFFLFYKQISATFIWIFILAVYISVSYLLKFVYKKYGNKLSVKYQIGRMARSLAKREKVN